MGNYEQLKQAVANVIKTNGNQEITGAIMQNTLLSIISTVGSNATFAGIATPTTNPGTPDQNVFYLASEPGIYINFGGVELIDQVIVLINKSGNWVKKDSGIATNAESLKLDAKFNLYKTAIFSDNLLNKNGSFIDGKYINGISGNKISLGTNSDYAVSDFIPVKGGSKYLGTEIGEGGAYSAFFDKNLNAISLFKSNENPTAPENATWCRLSCFKSGLYAAIFSERSEPFTEYIPYNDSFDVELLKRSLNSRFSVDLWKLINGKLINVDGSVGSNDSFSVSDFIPFNIKKGLFFKLQTSTNKYVSCIALYDENKQFVKSYSNIDTVVSEHIIKSEDIPDNVVYFRCTIEPGKGASLNPNINSYKQYDNYVIYGELIESEKIKEVSNDVILLKNTNELSDENKVIKYVNLFDINDSDYKEDYFISQNGNEVTNKYSSLYAVTGYIKIPNIYDCISINYEVGNVYAALYDKDKNFIKSQELRNGNRQIDFEFGAYYVRFTILISKKSSTMIIVGLSDLNIQYSDYGKVYELDKPTDDYIKGVIKDITNIKTPKYDNVYKDSLSDGGELELTEIPDSKNYYGIGCVFNTQQMGTIKIYKSQNDYCRGEINIDATNITEFGNGGEETIIPHGLTITDGLVVSIVKGTINTSITLTNTAGEKVTKQLSKWIGCRGGIIKFISISGTYTNITLSHSGTWMDKDTWIFGNSYTDFWPSKCYANGGSNFYLDGYSGRSAQGGYDSLLLTLKYGKPKRIVWMLGMNNPDTEIAVNESWNNIFNELKKLCAIMNIQLIPCTIPNVPERIHTFKNQIIRNSGLPYIDISSVLGANEKGSNWFSRLLSSDNVHPTGLGSEIIANTIIAGVPDIVE